MSPEACTIPSTPHPRQANQKSSSTSTVLYCTVFKPYAHCTIGHDLAPETHVENRERFILFLFGQIHAHDNQ